MSEVLLRTDLFVTTALRANPTLHQRTAALASELNAPIVPRNHQSVPELFAQHPEAERALLVQTDRLTLADRDGHTFFYHPNMAFLRLGNLLRGFRDLLVDATQLQPGESVLDATLGYASEAVLCAYLVGETGEVHGIEAVPELGIVVREGMKVVETDQVRLNAAMRRVQVVHLGDHLDYLRACPSKRYDVICFDPFFGEELKNSEQFAPIRSFGDHSELLPEAVEEARRVARRRILIKTTRWSKSLEQYGITERISSRSGKVAYGVVELGS